MPYKKSINIAQETKTVMTEKKERRGGNRKPAEHKMRIECLLKLKDNNWDYKKTSEETGFPIRTLTNWKTLYGKQVYLMDSSVERYDAREISNMVTRTRGNLIIRNNEIIAHAVEVQDELIGRIREVLKTDSNLAALAKALQVISEIADRKLSGQDDVPGAASQVNTYNQYITNQVFSLQREIEWKNKKLAEDL